MQVKAKKKEEKKPQKAMDAGARGRRLLQRREYRAKVSEFIPKELEDQFSHDENGQLVFELDFKKIGDKLKRGLKNFINKPIMKDYPTQKQYQDAVKSGTSHQYQSYEPEGEMIEANSAQMKAMHDAQMKKKEDDKVAAKKKGVKEGTKYGLYKGSGKASGAFKDYLDKKKKEKKKVEEGKEEGGYISNAAKAEVRNQRRFGKKGSAEPTGRFGQGTSEKAKLAVKRGEEHKARRGVKTKKEEVQLEAKKSCGEGEYYCYDDQKCKSIPEGMKVGNDGMLVKEDMKGMSQKSGDKRSTESGAGMTAKGVAKYNRRTGGNLKTAVTTPPSKLKPGSKAAKRRKSFCARSKSWDGPRGKAARRRWNCSYEPELPMIIDEKKKLFNTAPLSDRVSNWSKKINEGDSYVKSDRNKFGLPKDLKSVEKKSDKKVTTGVNYGAMAQSYEPQGEMIDERRENQGMSDLAKKMNLDPTKPGEYMKLKRLLRNQNKDKAMLNMGEAKMTSSEKDKKEKYVKGMKKDKKGFTKRYGKDGESVMYATATKMAMKKEAYGDVPFRDGRVKKYLGKDNISNIKLTQKGKQAFRTIPDPKIFSGNKAINPDNPITKMYRSLDRMNMSYEPEGETLVEKPGDGYLGPTFGKNNNIGIPNPIRIAKDAVDQMNRANLKKVNTVNKISPGSATMPKFNQFNKDTSAAYKNLFQSHEPEGEMTEAKYEKGASTYGKASIRNKRMFGKGGNAAPPEERGAAIKVRRARHQERRYVKKGNKYHEPGKHRPEVYGVNKPEEERKGKNIKEGSLHKWFKGSKSKDGKPGWVNVVTGGTCASDKKGEGTPKCVSSSKRASMTKAERLSASRRKKKADPGQQSKSGAAKPTYVATDKKKKVDEMNQGPSTPVGNYDGKIMPKFGAGRIGNVRLKGGKTIADLLKKV